MFAGRTPPATSAMIAALKRLTRANAPLPVGDDTGIRLATAEAIERRGWGVIDFDQRQPPGRRWLLRLSDQGRTAYHER